MSTGEPISKDVPTFLGLLNEMKTKLVEVSQHVASIKKHVSTKEFTTEDGISLLEVKNHLMLSYLINLVQLMLRKSEGEPIAGLSCINRLVEIRTVMEKIRPLEQKLHYQVDKLIKIASTKATTTGEPLHYRPNPQNLISKLDEDSGSSDDEENGKTGETQLYVPPKVRPMHYDEDSGTTKQQRTTEKLKKRALKSSLMQELREELQDMPLEVKDSVASGFRQRKIEEEKQRERYEEEHFVRLQHKRRREDGRGVANDMNQLLNFSDIRALTDDQPSSTMGTSSKRRRVLKKVTKKKRKGRRGRH